MEFGWNLGGFCMSFHGMWFAFGWIFNRILLNLVGIRLESSWNLGGVGWNLAGVWMEFEQNLL